MRIFLAGIIQGSCRNLDVHSQDYRATLRAALEESIPSAHVYDPTENHKNSVLYSDEVGSKVFFTHNFMCREVDIIIAFVPEASMGTAIEMWEGYQNGAFVVCITPLTTNWTTRFLTHKMYADMDSLIEDIRNGNFQKEYAAFRETHPKLESDEV
ncbi:MAG: hypothetical protein Q4D38_08220 [Planctomycetia bacterium]|nr:hypothetical protein [Planctomycetia bacterium]